MERLPDIFIEASKENRKIIETFMELPELYLPLKLRWNEIMSILDRIENIVVTPDEAYSALTLREKMCRIKYGPLHESDSTLQAAFDAIIYFIKNFE